MAIIYSYPGNPDLLPSDMLVGTSTKTYLGKIKNETKNFSLDALSYFTSTSQYNTLNTVLDNGNNSLLDANIGRLGLYDANGLAYAVIKVFTSEFEFYSAHYPLTPIVTFNDSSLVFNNMSHTSTILTGTPTANRTYTLPNNSGTIALVSDIPVVVTPTLQTVTAAGNTTSNNIIVNNGAGSLVTISNNGIFFESLVSHGAIFTTSGFSLVDDLTTKQFGLDFNGLYLKTISAGAGGSIKADLLTSTQRTYQLPNASGTFALTSDIPTLTTTGSSGPATLIGGVLNVPDYSSGISPGIQHGTATGTDTYTVTISGVAAYADGDAYLVRFTNGNTTGSTLNINGLGAIPLYRNNDGAVIGGDIWAGAEMLCVYNSTITAFQCIGTSSNSLFAYVTNADSVAITKGQPVYAFGGQGDRLTVKRASCTGDATSAQTVGVVLTSSIGVNQKGIIIIQGLLDGLNILPTSTWADGDPVYLGTTAGSITNVKQYAPNHLVYLGTVTTASNGSAGRWYVRVQNGYELDELHNVQAQSPSLKDTLWYDSGVTPGQWKTASIPTILGYTPFSLPSLSSGSVLFSDGTTIAQDNNNFFWNNSTKKLGIGTSTPSATFTIQDSAGSQILLKSTVGIEGIESFSGGTLASYDITTGGTYQYGPLTMLPSIGSITYVGQSLLYGNITTGYIPRKASIGVEDSLIYDNGTNVGIGTTSPSGKLHVDGSMYLQNSATGVESITFSNGPQIEANGPVGYFKSGQVYTNTFTNFVGIGTSSPTTELEVIGVITATGGNSTSWNAKVGGSGTTNYVSKFTAGSTLGNSMIFDNGTSVGINNGSPSASYKLDVSGSSRFSGAIFTVENNNFPTLRITDTSAANRYWALTTSKSAFGDFEISNAANATALIMNQSNGNTGIGNAYSTTSKLLITDTTLAGSGSLAGSALTINQTWNTTGNPSAIKLNVTNTASGGSGRLLDLQTGGTTRFFVSATGQISANSLSNTGGFLQVTGYATISGGLFTTPLNAVNGTNTTLILQDRNFSIAGTNLRAGIGTISSTSGQFNNFAIQPIYNQTTGTAANTDLLVNRTETAVGSGTQLLIDLQVGSVSQFSVNNKGKITQPSTITPAGTTGAQTINKPSGKVNAAAGTTSLVVTNSLVTTSSIVMCQLGTNDASCVIKSVVESSGSFTINYVAPTAETVIKFSVIN